jgi:hypothetical protein
MAEGYAKTAKEQQEDTEGLEQSSGEDSVDLGDVTIEAQRAEKERIAKAILGEGRSEGALEGSEGITQAEGREAV